MNGFSLEHGAVIVVAVLLDLLVGDPRWLPHPVVYIGRRVTQLEGGLRRLIKHESAAGLLLLTIVVGVTWCAATGLLRLAYAVSPLLGLGVALYLSCTALAARSLHLESRRVADLLVRGDLAGARTALSFIVGRDTEALGAEEIWRATIETVTENTSDGVIAPLFYLMIGGPALALAYKAVNTLDSMVGYRNDRYILFGRASARCDDLANWLPARLTGLLMVLAAPLAGLPANRAWRIMRRDGRNHSSPNSGIPEAAGAGALGVRLGGTNLYGGVAMVKPAIGDNDRPLSLEAYRGAVRLMYGAEGVLIGFWLLLLITRRVA